MIQTGRVHTRRERERERERERAGERERARDSERESERDLRGKEIYGRVAFWVIAGSAVSTLVFDS